MGFPDKARGVLDAAAKAREALNQERVIAIPQTLLQAAVMADKYKSHKLASLGISDLVVVVHPGKMALTGKIRREGVVSADFTAEVVPFIEAQPDAVPSVGFRVLSISVDDKAFDATFAGFFAWFANAMVGLVIGKDLIDCKISQVVAQGEYRYHLDGLGELAASTLKLLSIKELRCEEAELVVVAGISDSAAKDFGVDLAKRLIMKVTV